MRDKDLVSPNKSEKKDEEVGYYLRYLIGKQILKKYAMKMISLLRSRMYQQMSKHQFVIINDQSHNIEGNHTLVYQPWMRSRTKKNSSFIESMISMGINYIPLFSIENKLIFLLNGVDMILYFILGFYLSVEMCFKSTKEIPLPIYNILSIYIYLQLFLICVQINTGVFEKGKYIDNRQIILLRCLMSFTFISRISTTIILLFIKIENIKPQVFIIIILGHYYTIFRFLTKLQDLVIQFQIIKKIVSMVVLLLVAYFIAHISSLIWISVGVQETESNEKSWISYFLKLDEQNINENQYLIYIASIHFIIVTMVTVGYGDIFPVSSTERVYNILIMIMSSFVFAYIVNAVGQILSEIYNAKKESEYKKQIINSYMKKKNISLELQQQILQYLYYYWKQSQTSKCDEEQSIINELSDELKQTLLMEAHKLVVQESAIFNQNFSEPLLQKAVQHIQQISLYPQQKLFQIGDKDNSAIYFVEEGSVEKYITLFEGSSQSVKGVHVVQTIEKGMYFGVLEFFSGQKRQFNIRSKDFSTLLCIARQDFINLLKDFSDDFERFCDIRDSLQFSHVNNEIISQCPSCKENNHSVDKCPFLHYIPDHTKIIAQNQYNYQETSRTQQKRKLTKNDAYNTYSKIFQLQSDQKKYIYNESDTIHLYQIEYLLLQDDEDDDDDENNEQNLKQDQKIFINTSNQDDKNMQNMQISMSLSVDHHTEIDRINNNINMKQNSFIPKNSMKLQNSFSGQFYEYILEEQVTKNKKSTFVNSINQANNMSDLNSQNAVQSSSNIKAKSPKKYQNQLDCDQSLDYQNYFKKSIPSISELSQNFNSGGESLTIQRERNNSIYSLQQNLPQNNNQINYNNNNNNYNNNNNNNNFISNSINPQISYSTINIGQRRNINELRKKNSIESSLNCNGVWFQRASQKKNTNKVLFQQVEEQIKKLQEQFIESQQHQMQQQNQGDEFLLTLESLKSYSNYKMFYNVDEVLKRLKKHQIQALKHYSSICFKHKFISLFNEDDSDYKKARNEQIKLGRSTLHPKYIKKMVSNLDKKNIQDIDLSSIDLQDSKNISNNNLNKQKKQLFADFIFKFNNESITNALCGDNNTSLKKSEDINSFHATPLNKFENNRDEQQQFKLDDLLLDSSKTSIYSIKYLPQFNNLELLEKDKKRYKEIDINETYRIEGVS